MAAGDGDWKPPQGDGDFYRRLLDGLHDGVYFVDRNRRIVYWNDSATRMTGYAREEMCGHHCHNNRLSHMDGTGQLLCIAHCPLSATIADGRPRDAQVTLRHKAGHRIPVRVRVNPIFNQQREIVGAVEIFDDDSAHRSVTRRAEELERLAFRDALTQVANRRYVEIRLQTAVREYQLHHDPFGLLLIDLDHFKEINDQHGHEIGDRALVSVASTLTGIFRSTDTVGRWGGDEFVVVIGHVSGNSLWQLASRCCGLVALARIPQKEEGVSLSISAGGAVFREGESIEALMTRADKVLYVSKGQGRGRATVDQN